MFSEIMTKSKIIKTLQQMKWLDSYWRVKDFLIIEDKDTISFWYNHGDMGEVQKIKYDKINNHCYVYELDNYYGDTRLVADLYM